MAFHLSGRRNSFGTSAAKIDNIFFVGPSLRRLAITLVNAAGEQEFCREIFIPMLDATMHVENAIDAMIKP
jgi:hypothetical protein